MAVVGFDLGNKSSVVAVAQRGGIDVLMNEVSSRQTPTLVGFGEKQRFVGDAALSQQPSNLKNTIGHLKRILGRSWSDPMFQEQKHLWSNNTLVELPGDRVGVQVTYKGETQVLTPEQLTAMVLEKLKDNAEKYVKVRVADSVVSVPGFWNDAQRRAMLDATRIAGLPGTHLINDLTAIGINYGLWKTNLPEDGTKAHQVMIVDVGDCHVSVGVISFWNGHMKVLAHAHDPNFGGIDFDYAFANHCANEFKEKKKLDIRTNAKAWFRVVGMCAKTKCNLNHNPQASVNVESLMDDQDMSVFVTRESYQALVKELAERVLVPVKQALELSGLAPADLNAVEIVGSGSRSTVIQQQLTTFLGKELSTTMNAEEAVSKGCALYAAMLSPKIKVKDYKVEDIQNYPIELSWHTIDDPSDTKESQLEVFKAFSTIPSGKHATFNRPDSRPFQITARYMKPEEAHSKNPVIAQFTIRNIPKPQNPTTDIPEVRIKVKVNANGVLLGESPELREVYEEEVKEEKKADDKKADDKKADDKMDVDTAATDAMQTDEKKVKRKIRWVPLNWEAKYTGGLDEATLTKFTSFEQQMQQDVAEAVALSDARNAVEAYVYKARDKLHSIWSEYATEAEKTKFGKELDDTENWLYEEGSEDQTSKAVFEKKLLELKAMGEPLALRLSEFEQRPKVVAELVQTLEHYEKCATESIDLYEHIKPEDKKKIADEVAKTRKWLEDITSKQGSLKKTDDPVLLTKTVQTKQDALKALADPILAQPKPKPAPKPAEPAPKPAEPAADAKPAEQQPAEDAKAPDTMDIDS